MKKVKKIISIALLFSLFASVRVLAAEGMVPGYGDNNVIYYRYAIDQNYQVDGVQFTKQDFLKNQWKQVWDNWYYFGEDEKSKYNTWAEIDGKWYYFDSFSRMLHDTSTPDGYTVGSDGAWIKDGQVVVETVTNN